MTKAKVSNTLSYLYLGVLALVTANGLEVVTEKYQAFTLPDDLTMKLTIASVYVLSGAFFLAFIANSKAEKEQKYILYLVVLSLTFFKLITFLKGWLF